MSIEPIGGKRSENLDDQLKDKGVVEKYAALVKGQEKVATFIENLTGLMKKNPELTERYDLDGLREKCLLFHDLISDDLKKNIDRGLEFQDAYGQAEHTVLAFLKAISDSPKKEKTYNEPLREGIAKFKSIMDKQLYPDETIH